MRHPTVFNNSNPVIIETVYMDGYFGSRFKADMPQSVYLRHKLYTNGYIMEDGSLKGPACMYSNSELWCYIHYLWSVRGDNIALNMMTSPTGEFDKMKALDVVLAIHNDHVSAKISKQGILSQHLFDVIKHLPYS